MKLTDSLKVGWKVTGLGFATVPVYVIVVYHFTSFSPTNRPFILQSDWLNCVLCVSIQIFKMLYCL